MLRAEPLGDFFFQGFRVQADGLASPGPGLLASAQLRLKGPLWAAASAGYFHCGRGSLFQLVGAQASLDAAPLHLSLLLRQEHGLRRFGLELEAGLGYTRGWIDADGVLPGGYDLDRLDLSEGNASILLGGRVTARIAGPLRASASLRYHQTFTTLDISENAVKFWLFGAGLQWSP